MSHFSSHCDKMPDKHNLDKKVLLEDVVCSGRERTVGAWGQFGHGASAVTKQRVMNADAQLLFSLESTLRTGSSLSHPQYTLSENTFIDMQVVYSYADSDETIKINLTSPRSHAPSTAHGFLYPVCLQPLETLLWEPGPQSLL